MVRSLLSARFSSRPISAVKPSETVTLVPKASPSSLLHCWITGASSGAAVRDKSSSKTPPVRIRCRSNFSFLRSSFGENLESVSNEDDSDNEYDDQKLEKGSDVVVELKAESDGERVKNCMRGSFAKAGVLYAPVEEIGSEVRQGIVCPLMLVAFISRLLKASQVQEVIAIKAYFDILCLHSGIHLTDQFAGYISHDMMNLQETLD
ncbi:hypothetical protein ACLB2K_029819 [Fragaria x ananassa]